MRVLARIGPVQQLRVLHGLSHPLKHGERLHDPHRHAQQGRHVHSDVLGQPGGSPCAALLQLDACHDELEIRLREGVWQNQFLRLLSWICKLQLVATMNLQL